MLEAAELGAKLKKADYESRLPQLRADLIQAQQDLRSAGFGVIVLIAGDDHRGCHAAINTLNEWLDPRGIRVHVFEDPTQEEAERPVFWRYWRALPANGRIGIFSGAWMFRAVADRLCKRTREAEFDVALERIRRFEGELADAGTLVVKFWLHRPEKPAVAELEKVREHPERYGAFGRTDQAMLDDFPRSMRVVERSLRETESASIPWHLVESTDKRHRDWTIAATVLAALQRHLARGASGDPAAATAWYGTPDHCSILDTVDLTQQLAKDDYRLLLARRQRKIRKLTLGHRQSSPTAVLLFEGWDAAGKGGVIRRLCAAIDAPCYDVVPIAAPSDEERARHYLWRFWRHIPRRGHITVFDRSWYGRVLVERVEGFAREDEWRRAYAEINDFEEQLAEAGIAVCKFWLHIDRDEQLARFQAREQTPFKRYKITEEDYRNRGQWPAYEQAINDMIAHTSTEFAPWHLIAANDKRHARIAVLSTVAKALKHVSG
ncbi:MAG: polyphosphate:AMP phosphotransferase [Planctomycetota bacterium]